MARRRQTARELEAAAARVQPVAPLAAATPGEVAAMLLRRGFRPTPNRLDLPFPRDLDGPVADALVDQLRHYSFRLFLRGAILRGETFEPGTATGYVDAGRSRAHAEKLVELGLATVDKGRYRLVQPARSFGGTLEWYVARELAGRYGWQTAAGLKFRARGVGGDLDVVAVAEGRLVYLELKTSPPKHLKNSELAAFVDRIRALRPDVSVFAVDTALRLRDKVVPMFEELTGKAAEPIDRELYALTPHVYLVNAKQDLIANIARGIAEGLRALAPPPP